MTENNTNVENLQEIVDKVLPPYTGDLKDALAEVVKQSRSDSFAESYEFCENFDLNAPHTEAEWYTLDMHVSRVGEEFPELMDAVKEHFSITMWHHDLWTIVSNAIDTALAIHNNPLSADEEKDAFEMIFSELLPASVEKAIREKFVNIEMRALETALDRANKVLAEGLYQLTSETFDSGDQVSIHFTCDKGDFFAYIDRDTCEALIFPITDVPGGIDFENPVYTNKDIEDTTEQTLIEEIEKFCML